MKTIAVYHRDTGHIRQLVECQEVDADKQHLPHRNHDYLDVTTDPERPHPNHHMVDVRARRVIPRVAPLAELKMRRLRLIEKDCAETVSGGFSSAATGRVLCYSSADQDRAILLQAVHVGGGLMAIDKAAGRQEWKLEPHSAEQAKAVLADFVWHQDSARTRLLEARNRLERATTASEIAAIV